MRGTAEYFVLAAPGTSRTRALIGAAQLARMSSQAWVVDVGRGSHSANPADARRAAIARRAAENVRRYADGDGLIGEIDPDAGF